MFSLMANCFTWIKKRREPRKKVTLLMVGLDNAGKTSTVARVKGENLENITPTVGFLMANFTFEKSEVTIFDLGGGPKIRDIWKDYFAEIYGVIYVVDSSDEIRIDECKKVLHELVSKTRVAGKPVLVLANKKDKEGAMSELEIDQRLELAHISEKYKTPYQVYSCSAVLGTGSKLDKQIKKGLQWLLHSINENFSELFERITNDVAIQKEIDAIELAKTRERVRKAREERARAEAQEAQEKEEESDDDLVVGTKKKKQVVTSVEGEGTPEVKRKKKKKKKKRKDVDYDNEDEEDIELQTSGRLTKISPPPSPKVENEIVQDDTDEETTIKPKKRRHKKRHLKSENDEHKTISKHIEPQNGPLRTYAHGQEKDEDINIHSDNRHENEHVETDDHIKKLNHQIVENHVIDDNLQNDQESIAPDVTVKKKKKKKKKLKANKTAPTPMEADEEIDKLPPLGWGAPPMMNGFGHGRAPPRLEPLRPPLRSTYDTRGIGDSIPEQNEEDSPVLRHNWARNRPNSEDLDIVT